MNYEPAVMAAQEYMKGLQLRKEMKSLSEDSLAEKFGYDNQTIRRICRGQKPRFMPESERVLILECREERDRLKAECKKLTVDALARKYRISRNTLKKYVDDWSEPSDGTLWYAVGS